MQDTLKAAQNPEFEFSLKNISNFGQRIFERTLKIFLTFLFFGDVPPIERHTVCFINFECAYRVWATSNELKLNVLLQNSHSYETFGLCFVQVYPDSTGIGQNWQMNCFLRKEFKMASLVKFLRLFLLRFSPLVFFATEINASKLNDAKNGIFASILSWSLLSCSTISSTDGSPKFSSSFSGWSALWSDAKMVWLCVIFVAIFRWNCDTRGCLVEYICRREKNLEEARYYEILRDVVRSMSTSQLITLRYNLWFYTFLKVICDLILGRAPLGFFRFCKFWIGFGCCLSLKWFVSGINVKMESKLTSNNNCKY